MTGPDDALIQSVLEGDLGAFDELMRRYERLVFKVAWSFGGSRENALDITQSVFLKVFRGLESFRTESNFKTWLLRIAYNEGVNWIRKADVHENRHISLEAPGNELTLDPAQDADLERREARRLIRAGLGQLNPRHRTAIVLRYFHGLGIREIAEVLRCSETMTKNMLFRGVRRLRQCVSDAQAVGGT